MSDSLPSATQQYPVAPVAGSSSGSFERQVETWLSILKRYTLQDIEGIVLSLKDWVCEYSEELQKKKAEAGVGERARGAMFRTAANALVENSRDDQLTANVRAQLEDVRKILHAYVKCYAKMLTFNTDTVCTSPIVVPSVGSWYRSVLRMALSEVHDLGWLDVQTPKRRMFVDNWLGSVIERATQNIAPINLFLPAEGTAIASREEGAAAVVAPVPAAQPSSEGLGASAEKEEPSARAQSAPESSPPLPQPPQAEGGPAPPTGERPAAASTTVEKKERGDVERLRRFAETASEMAHPRPQPPPPPPPRHRRTGGAPKLQRPTSYEDDSEDDEDDAANQPRVAVVVGKSARVQQQPSRAATGGGGSGRRLVEDEFDGGGASEDEGDEDVEEDAPAYRVGANNQRLRSKAIGGREGHVVEIAMPPMVPVGRREEAPFSEPGLSLTD